MIDNPLSLSKDGLTALSDAELAQKIKDALETMTAMQARGEDSSVQEKVYEAYVSEYNHRSKGDAPTKPSGLKAVKF
jgi:glutamate synthase domain-containing protein 1